LDLAGQQGAAVHRHCIRDVHPTQVQVDELWSFVKKNQGGKLSSLNLSQFVEA
jgi:hypothetical protein